MRSGASFETRRLRRRSSGRGDDLWPWGSQCRVGGVGSPARVLAIVVLASHWSPTRTRLRCSAVKPWRSNSGLAESLASTVRRFAPRACASFVKRLDQRAARALASEFGIDEQHVDLVCAFEAGEAGDRAVDHGEQGQRALQAGRRKPVRHRRARPRPRAALRRSHPRRAHRCSSERSRRSVVRRPADRGEARRRSSLGLPGRGAILVVFDGDAERGKMVAQAVGLGPIACRARCSAFGDDRVDLGRCRSLPRSCDGLTFRSRLLQEAEKIGARPAIWIA